MTALWRWRCWRATTPCGSPDWPHVARSLPRKWRAWPGGARDRVFEAEARLLRALAGLELGDASALSDLDEFDRMAAALHQPRFDYLMVTRRAAVATMIGQFARAEQLIIEAGRLARRTGEPDSWNVQSRLWWRLRSVQGRRSDAKVRGREMPNFALKFWFDLQHGLILLEQGHGRTDCA